MLGTGEYTTGYVDGKPANSDKSAGVVALTMFDLRKRGKVDRLGLCGVNGSKFPGIREHFESAIGKVYKGLDLSIETFPTDNIICNPKAYVDAIKNFKRGDAVTIFTPDDTHFEIAMACIKNGLHVLVTKPAVKTLEQHIKLYEAAKLYNVLVCVEVHKRWDPMYADARDKIKTLGPFSYLYAFMSQPKHQLETFRSWAGKSSDISYYLNSHHIDFNEWCVGTSSRPIAVTALASTGLACNKFESACEDTITLTVQWENLSEEEGHGGNSLATAVYTSSWIAPKSDVHSQQRFFYMGQKGEINIDQAHRGYSIADDLSGFRSVNPLFMKYTPTDGVFSGQNGYGYRSFEYFVDAVTRINNCLASVGDFDHTLASLATTFQTTAILEAGRRSLDEKKTVNILYEDNENTRRPTKLL